MRKRKNSAMIINAGAGFACIVLLISAFAVSAGVVDPCNTTVTATGGCIAVCPAGDGQTLAEQGTVIHITVRDGTGLPIASIPATDLWLIGCPASELILCSGYASIDADGPTDDNGYTTMSGTIHAGTTGDVTGVSVVIQGEVIGCPSATCLPILVRSFDVNGDLVVNIYDMLKMADDYDPDYSPVCDFNNDGKVNLSDLARFSFHFAQSYDHVCP
jgi:hypothetical protein